MIKLSAFDRFNCQWSTTDIPQGFAVIDWGGFACFSPSTTNHIRFTTVWSTHQTPPTWEASFSLGPALLPTLGFTWQHSSSPQWVTHCISDLHWHTLCVSISSTAGQILANAGVWCELSAWRMVFLTTTVGRPDIPKAVILRLRTLILRNFKAG